MQHCSPRACSHKSPTAVFEKVDFLDMNRFEAFVWLKNTNRLKTRVHTFKSWIKGMVPEPPVLSSEERHPRSILALRNRCPNGGCIGFIKTMFLSRGSRVYPYFCRAETVRSTIFVEPGSYVLVPLFVFGGSCHKC